MPRKSRSRKTTKRSPAVTATTRAARIERVIVALRLAATHLEESRENLEESRENHVTAEELVRFALHEMTDGDPAVAFAAAEAALAALKPSKKGQSK